MATQLFENGPLASVALRSLVLLAVTLGIAAACRRRSAAVNHHVWVLGIVGCLLIPIVTLLAPNVAVPLLPTAQPPQPVGAVVTIPAGRFAQLEVPQMQMPPMQQAPMRLANEPLPEPAQENRVQALPTADPTAFAWPSPQAWLVIAWGVGAAICMVRLTWQLLMVRHAVRHCPEVTSESWCKLRDAVAYELHVRQAISLRAHAGATSPMVVGFLRPLVLLPSDAEQWTLDRKRQVLLHELAHVQRRDVLTQSLAGLACALYWFNPLAWLGATQMKRLREIACDDIVVLHTTRPSHYAETLLDVAKQYRCRQQICTVAMARTAQVEGRIRAILDATRQRASLTKRSARMVGIAAVVLSIVVGSLQLTTRAAEQESSAAEKEATEKAGSKETDKETDKEEAPKDEASELRTITVRVLDEAGQPVSKANVLAGVWNLEPTEKRFPNRYYTTNDEGEAKVEIPRLLRILRLWASKSQHVPLFVNFAEGTHEDGRLIPETYEFRMQPGHRLSGLVVDDEGQPVANARVQVMVDVNDRFAGPNPKPGISTWLSSGADAVRTDKEGRWEVTNAPAPRENADYKFRILVTHADFAGDTNWGGLQAKQGITVEQLRDGTAKLMLPRGRAITGRITGPDGKPVTKGLVVWDDDPYLAQGVNEAQIGAQGEYKTLQLAPGEYPITVLAPGFAPEQRKVKLDDSLAPVDFQLEAGNKIQFKFVDQAGKPIPEAYVQIGMWRGTEAIFNHKHPNVPDSGIPRRADKDGLYTWAWAPADAVQYRIGALGYGAKELSLAAKAEPHEVKLSAMPAIFGRVVDAKSGKPIDKFRVIPVKAFRPDFYSTDFQDSSVVEGKDGEYRIELDTYGQAGNRYNVRIEAEGYRTAFGEKSLTNGDPPVEENFKLEPAPALLGVVVDASGSPVKEFFVAVGTPTSAPSFSLERPDSSFGISFRVEGTNEFRLPATFEPQRIRVFNDSGFAELFRQPDEQIGTITLQPWTSVSGRLVQDGKPITGETIYLFPLANRGLKEARFQDAFAVPTDSSGNFHFDRVPPWKASIRPALGPFQDSVLTSGESVPLDLKPGDQKEVTLGGGQATIIGRIVATGSDADKLSKRWSLNYLISRDRGVDYPRDAEPLGFSFSGPVEASWLRQQNFQRWVATRENYFVKLTDDGQMKVQGVRPGEYDLVIQLYEQPAGCLVETIGEKVVPITVAEGQTKVETGDIEVAVRRGPRVGSDMRAYKFIDAAGREQSVDELNGKYVLFHVWASWCQPCLTSMPAVKASVEQHASDRLTVVGLNVDKDAAAARPLAQQGGWNWAQNYLGDNSDLMRQLGVSSVPAYYLIGPDGKLVGSANAWEQMEKLLSAEFK